MKTYAFADQVTGLLKPDLKTLPADQVERNTPAGYIAVEGVTDPYVQRVDVETGEIVDYLPPPPPGDDLRTWVWHAVERRYVETPTPAGVVHAQREAIRRQILVLEEATARPLRELMLAPGDPAALARLADLNAQIATLRASMPALPPTGA